MTNDATTSTRCTGTTSFAFTNGVWGQTGTSGCSGDCPRGQTCTNTLPTQILGNPELEQQNLGILPQLRNPTEGTKVKTRCSCH